MPELLRRIHADEPETKQVKRHMLLWLDNLDLGAIARFVQYENHPEREYNRSRLRSRQVMSEGHYLQGWSLITPKEIDDRDPWSILGYSTPKVDCRWRWCYLKVLVYGSPISFEQGSGKTGEG